MTIEENTKELGELKEITNSITTFGRSQYGWIHSYMKENNVSFQDALLNLWIKNRIRKVVCNFDMHTF